MAGEYCKENKFQMAKSENEMAPGIEPFLIHKEILTEYTLK
jgi:hypothetical protein